MRQPQIADGVTHTLTVAVLPMETDLSVNDAVGLEASQHMFNPATGVGWLTGWQIGGRWSGYFDGYQPRDDNRNMLMCSTCDFLVPEPDCGTCNGQGEYLASPEEFFSHEGDMALLGDVRDKLLADSPHRIIGPEMSFNLRDAQRSRHAEAMETLNRLQYGLLAVVLDTAEHH